MDKADNPRRDRRQSLADMSADLVIVGAGIMGLWAAVKAERLGMDTLLIDEGDFAGGASGGLLGALMAHMPDKWSDKKQFQFDSLVGLEAEIAAIEAETGLSAGYRRCGRIIPLPKPHLRPIAQGHANDAAQHWKASGREFFWHVRDRPPVDGWIDPAAGPHGFVFDTLAGRVSPRALCRVLIAFLQKARHVRLLERNAVTHIDPQGMASLADGRTIGFSHIVVAAGHRSFPMLGALKSSLSKALGQPVKGQAALLQYDGDPSCPIIFQNGLYVVAHEDGRVAIGSTSEEDYASATHTDALLDRLIARAGELVPALKTAVVIERWAGLRPKAVGRDPMVGVHPDFPRIVALTGGFKVSFGLAHRLADAALAALRGQIMDMPPSFQFSHHLSVSRAGGADKVNGADKIV